MVDFNKPLYESSYMGTWVKVYPNRIMFKTLAGEKSISIMQVASIQLGIMGHMKIDIETTGGQKFTIPTSKKKEVRDAIYNAQSIMHS